VASPAYHAARRAALRAAGLCIYCRAPSAGRASCAACAAKRRDRSQAERSVRRAAGLCDRCGGPSAGRPACEACAAKYRASQRVSTSVLRTKRRAAGLCIRCGGLAAGLSQCAACAAAGYKRSTAWKVREQAARLELRVYADPIACPTLDVWREFDAYGGGTDATEVRSTDAATLDAAHRCLATPLTDDELETTLRELQRHQETP